MVTSIRLIGMLGVRNLDSWIGIDYRTYCGTDREPYCGQSAIIPPSPGSTTCKYPFEQVIFAALKVYQSYVDEVQDHTILDIKRERMSRWKDILIDFSHSVLHSLVRNRDGFCWAGDTAQTIAAGSAFRFDDLKAVVHRLEVHLRPSPVLRLLTNHGSLLAMTALQSCAPQSFN
jgi:hypothetical protein